ncbi:DUF3822 family protein [Pontimicrobium sp. MEBiC06410]
METGQNFMTLKSNNSIQDILNKELSIQISLNGLSFCILNTETNTITTLKHIAVVKKQTPFELLDTLKHLFNTEQTLHEKFSKVTVIHVNELSTLVPKALFNENAIADYLKLNTKILKTDFITFDELLINDSVNVYIPYININNYIYDTFGSFEYKHFSSVLIEHILSIEKHSKTSKLYVNVAKTHFEIIAIDSGDLILYNTFNYNTEDDFIYYILFTIEQLNYNPELIDLIFIGDITKEHKLYDVVYKYIRNVSFGNRYDTYNYTELPSTSYSDFTLIKSL